MKREHCRIFATVAAMASIMIPLSADAQEWQHTVILYGMGAAIDGTSQVGDVVVPVDASISDVFDALDFGAMGAFRADNATWSITGDTTYMGLGGSAETNGGLVKGDVGIDQLTLMGTVGRRIGEHVEMLFSLGYFDLSADLDVKTRNPLNGAVTRRKAETDADWIDPLVGLHADLPLAERWTLNLRGDVGGFGVGSDLTYQLLAAFQWRSAGRVGAVAGYRLIAFDYEDGQRGGRSYQRFDLTEQGPLAGVTYSFWAPHCATAGRRFPGSRAAAVTPLRARAKRGPCLRP